MFDLLVRFVERRRRSLTVLATAIGSGYFALSYIKSKLVEVQNSLSRQQQITENLRRRFHQNQDDCLFTVTALIPTLGNQILDTLNVERLADLLNQTKKSRSVGPPERTTDPILAEELGPTTLIPHDKVADSQPDDRIKPHIAVNSSEANPANQSKAQRDTHDFNSSAVPLNTSQAQSNGVTKPNSVSTLNESVVDVLLRPDGTALRKRSEIWEEVMVLSFTRLFTCIYAIALLTMQTHIQLGLLGRDAYLISVIGAEELDSGFRGAVDSDQLCTIGQHELVDTKTEQRYLTLSWWYLHHGWKILAKRIRCAVEEVLSEKSLKDEISLSDLLQMFTDIRHKVEQTEDGGPFSFSAILLPPTPSDELETLKSGGMALIDCVVDSRLRELLNETQDFVNCDDFRTVLSKAMERVTHKCLENVAQKSNLEDPQMKSQISQHSNQLLIHPRFVELSNEEQPSRSARFVAILPVVTRESHLLLNSLPNAYIELLSTTSELKEFSSLIYTSYEVSA